MNTFALLNANQICPFCSLSLSFAQFYKRKHILNFVNFLWRGERENNNTSSKFNSYVNGIRSNVVKLNSNRREKNHTHLFNATVWFYVSVRVIGLGIFLRYIDIAAIFDCCLSNPLPVWSDHRLWLIVENSFSLRSPHRRMGQKKMRRKNATTTIFWLK